MTDAQAPVTPTTEQPKTPIYQVVKVCPKCTNVFSTNQVTETVFHGLMGTPNFESVILDGVFTARTNTLCPTCMPNVLEDNGWG
jgi:hypothetical protein